MAVMAEPRPATAPDLPRLLERGLGNEARRALATAARLAEELGVSLHLVGGPVRDLLLGRSPLDLDLTVSPQAGLARERPVGSDAGGAARFARRLAAELGGEAASDERFPTARVRFSSGPAIDVAGARSETYPAPGALPAVFPAGLAADLARRDFTVNALAVRLAPPPAPVLVDPAAGLPDLAARRLRTLHGGSFRDDPTRILRGARLAARLGFRFAAETEREAREAAAGGAFATLSGDRLRAELALLLAEEGAVAALELLEELGALDAILPGTALDGPARRLLESVPKAAVWASERARPALRLELWRLRLLALVGRLGREAAARAAERLGLEGGERELVAGCGERLDRARARLARGRPAPHEASAALAPLGAEELVLLTAEGGAAGDWARRELAELRSFALAIGGRDLVARGHPPGPAIGRALAATRAARLDGAIGEGEELEFALAALARETGTAATPAGDGEEEGGA